MSKKELQKEEGGNVSRYVMYVSGHRVSVVNYDDDVEVSTTSMSLGKGMQLWKHLESAGYR